MSAPITFDELEERQTFPLKRDDCDRVDAMRVSLTTAVYFIANLQQKEELTFPNTNDNTIKNAHSAEAYAEDILHKADESGIKNVWEAKDALRRVIAAR